MVKIVAGPCSIGSLDQILETGKMLKEQGVDYFRGGVWKYRSDPKTFQGFGDEAIEWLKELKRITGLKIVTEVFNWNQAEKLEDVTDIFQIGSRNAYNTDLLRAIDSLAKTVIYKRHFAMSLHEFTAHANYFKSSQVIFCLRGILSIFPQEQRFFPDVMDILRLRNMTDNPIMYDVSHSGCDAQYIPALTEAALAFKPDWIMIEVHGEPKKSFSDPLQALDFETFKSVVKTIN